MGVKKSALIILHSKNLPPDLSYRQGSRWTCLFNSIAKCKGQFIGFNEPFVTRMSMSTVSFLAQLGSGILRQILYFDL